MIQPGRKYASSSSKYRYSINGQEKDVELNENITTAEYWDYDSRIGRRWNVDPIYKNSPYECFGSNPIWNVDKCGLDSTIYLYSYKAKVSSEVDGPGKKAVKLILKNLKRIMEANGLKGFKYKVIDQEDFTSGSLKVDPSDAILGITGTNGGINSIGASYSYPNQAAVPQKDGFPGSWLSTYKYKELAKNTNSDYLALTSIGAAHEVLHQYLFKANDMFGLNKQRYIHSDFSLNLNSTGNKTLDYLNTIKINSQNLLSHTTEGKIAYIQKFQVVYINGYFNAMKSGANPSGADAGKASTLQHLFPNSKESLLKEQINGLKSWIGMMTDEN